MKHFKTYDKQDVLSLTRLRRFETRLGESIQVIADKAHWEESLAQSTARYIMLGIPEDIGVRANHGVGGTDSIWVPFLSAFLNIQSNDFLVGDEILLMGHFDFGDLKYVIEQNAQSYDEKIDAYRHAVNTIDDEVEELIRHITALKKVPIVIGGGHNNAYPLIKGAAKGLHKAGILPLAQINSINLDAHSDFRPAEGRHSGNGFRYAEEDGYLQKYCIIGLHENYLPQNVWLDIVNNPFMDFITYEDIFVHEKRTFMQAVAHATTFTEDGYTGIELDLDCIEKTLSSALTPAGILPLHARQYLAFTGSDSNVAYLHICEGAAQLADGRKDETTGKLVSYLVSDFIKAHDNTTQVV
ncbi:arginase family protein [Paraflavitalea sp. CAU 1676]|uniref:arginase family protein n=1 Tax=Paraflavitalea sp. CAU 1676 TaxID=3032598 RepID=UPI0023DA80B0|nr:arginase family protein [Paraflavitalea sp. CAU 1676]MDF2192071.1 arginase family protein [Paraflavitalea sp. CAU 1676]